MPSSLFCRRKVLNERLITPVYGGGIGTPTATSQKSGEKTFIVGEIL